MIFDQRKSSTKDVLVYIVHTFGFALCAGIVPCFAAYCAGEENLVSMDIHERPSPSQP